MVAAAPKRPRPTSPLVEAVAALGGTPVPTPIRPDLEEVPLPEENAAVADAEAAIEYPMDTVHINGTFGGYEVTYITAVSPDSAAIELGRLVTDLRAIGFLPREAPAPVVQAPSPSFAPAQNGDTGGNFGGQPQEAPDWQQCGHGPQYIKNGNYGLECGFSSPNHFPGAREYNGRNGTTYYCTARPPRQNGGGGGNWGGGQRRGGGGGYGGGNRGGW